MRSLVLIALALAGCGTDQRHPGPCTSTKTNTLGHMTVCTWTYDDQDRMTGAECITEDGLYRQTQTFVHTADGLASASYYATDGGGSEESSWVFGAATTSNSGWRAFDSLQSSETEYDYDEDELVLTGSFSDPERLPIAPDAITSAYGASHDGKSGEDNVFLDETYTYTGDRASGTRTRTSADGDTVVFTYDDQGRLTGGTVDVTYDGDHVASIGDDITYEHDAVGNLIRSVAPDAWNTEPATMTYDYGCW